MNATNVKKVKSFVSQKYTEYKGKNDFWGFIDFLIGESKSLRFNTTLEIDYQKSEVVVYDRDLFLIKRDSNFKIEQLMYTQNSRLLSKDRVVVCGLKSQIVLSNHDGETDLDKICQVVYPDELLNHLLWTEINQETFAICLKNSKKLSFVMQVFDITEMEFLIKKMQNGEVLFRYLNKYNKLSRYKA